HLHRYLISELVEIVDRTSEFAQFHLAGPRAKEIMTACLWNLMPDEETLYMVRTFAPGELSQVRRQGLLGQHVYDIVSPPGYGEIVWRAFRESGATPAGLQA